MSAARATQRESVRAFLAVELDDAARDVAQAIVAALRSQEPGGDVVRWVRPESLHVTLRFLGDVPLAPEEGRACVGDVERSVADEVASHAPFALRLAECIAIPSKSRARVIALDVTPHAPLEALAAAVERAVVALGFAPEGRAFRPHVTLGRVRRGADRVAVRSLFGHGEAPDRRDPFQVDQQVEEAVLFRSDLASTGATYTPLARFALGAAS